MTDKFLFETHYHPYVCDFLGEIAAGPNGVMSLLRPDGGKTLARQQTNNMTVFDLYAPTGSVEKPYPVEDIDFSPRGAYAQYNWELFFHIPLLIATQLSQNQRFEEAQRWFHTIFDPTNRELKFPAHQRYWKVRPLFENSNVKVSVARMLELLDAAPTSDFAKAFRDQIRQWLDDPFNPHLIARGRWAAYQKTVVMKYLDNLIAWGDQLFGRETIEAINEATQLYVLAAEILGERPRELPERNLKAKTYRELEPALDAFSNAPVALEGYLPPQPAAPTNGTGPPASCAAPTPKRPEELATLLSIGQSLYFCVPQNDVLLGYWDTVADRLFKVRNCMDLEGRVRQLPLFEPPIDPALLVRAVAAGVDLGSILADLYAPRPHYRFSTMLQRALDYANEVRSLGAALLAAMEKRDGEELARLRSTHEIALLDATRAVKRLQVDDATHALEALHRMREMVAARQAYYKGFELMNGYEKEQLGLLALAGVALAASQALELPAAPLHLGASLIGSVGPFPVLVSQPAASAEAGSKKAAILAGASTTMASMTGILGGHTHRKDDADLQADLATHELAQLDAQILAAEVRLEIAKGDYRNHDLQRRQAKKTDDQMRRKFTNRELYTWTVTQLSRLYFQTYRLAYDFAKRVERTLEYELGPATSRPRYVDAGSWDSLRKGLLAGERLALGLRRMEVDYLDANRREYEVSKSFSLAMLDPIELLRLKQSGQATLRLPERLYDLDYPGHYMRRIKAVAVTVPCVMGPYTSVNCTLTLMRNRVRHNPRPSANGYVGGEGDDRFTESVAAMQSIVTSSALNDSGLFDLNFRDERYLPFEGAGAESEWLIELGQDTNHFDVQTITDVILNLRYTARDGGERLRRAARAEISAVPKDGLVRLFSAKHEFSDAWYRFLHPTAASAVRRLDLTLSESTFPFHPRQVAGKRVEIRVKSIDLYLKPADPSSPGPGVLSAEVLDPATSAPKDLKPFEPNISFTKAPDDLRGLLHAPAPTSISFKPASKGHLAIAFASDATIAFDDLLVVCKYDLV